MFKKKLKARVVYRDTEGNEGYAIEILNGKEWITNAFYPLRIVTDGDVSSEYLHYGFIKELGYLQLLGYSIGIEVKRCIYNERL